MKIKAIKEFRDLNERRIRRKGEVFEVTEERYEEINSTAYGILAEEIEELPVNPDESTDQEVKTEEDTDNEDNSRDFEAMKKQELFDYAKEIGLELNMRDAREDMIKELTEWIQQS